MVTRLFYGIADKGGERDGYREKDRVDRCVDTQKDGQGGEMDR